LTATYEDNHAFISVLHEDSCIYFDPDWGGAETGSRRTPYNNIEDDVTYEKNYAYLSKRGTAWSGDVTIASTMDSDIDNPLIFGAYDEGDRPIWYDGTNELVWIDSRTDTIEHVQFYDIDCWGNDGASTIKPDDYSWHTKFNRVRATRGDGNGCFMSNHALATTYNHNVFRDCEADSGYGYGFKMSSGRDTLENCMISNCNTGISFNWSNGGYAEYIWTSSNGDGSASAFTFDCDSNTVKHAIIYGYNVGLKFIDDDTPDSDVEGNLVEDCWHNQEMDLGSTNSHLYFSTNADRNTVQRCFFRNSEYAIDINSSCDTNWLNYIVVINADDFSIDNDGTGNICDHIVTYDHQASDIIGSGTGVLRNSIYTSASGLTSSDSILWGSIMDSDYVYDTIAGQEDFRLKAGATLAIDAGTDLGITRDLHDYIIPQGSAPDIGAYERIVDNVIQIGGINRWIIINDRKFIQFYDSIQEYHIDDTLDFLYNFAVHNTAAAVYDWIRMGITATLVNSPVHTAYEGFLTDGASSYGKINYNPGTDAVHWRLNSASFGVYIRTNDYTTVKWLIGMGDASNVADIYFLSSTKFRFRINNNGAVYEDVVHENDISGFTILTRQNATTGAYARNSDTYSTISINSSGIPNQALGIFVGAYNNNGSVGYYSPNQFSFAFGGGQLTETQATKLYEAMERFLDAYGTGVN